MSGDRERIQALEQENRKLNQTCSVDKRSLVKLREELVSEKLGRDTLATELEGLKRQLGKLGVSWQAVLEEGAEALNVGVSEERVRSLEGSMSALMESGKKRAAALEVALKEAQEEKAEWQQKAELLQLKVIKLFF